MTAGGAIGRKVSLLMPNRDGAATLDLVLGRLAAHTTYPKAELIVVDDGSVDDSRPMLRRWRDSGRFGDFNLIEKEASGVVDTLNAGLAAATGEIVVQLDADASIETPGWLETMLAFFLSDERIGVLSPKVIIDTGVVHAYGVTLVDPAGMHDRGTRPTEPVGRRSLHSRVERFPEAPGDVGSQAAEVDAGIGCCMMYRREVALAVGGYDPGFQPVWFDDLDLALSIRRAGYKAFFVPDVRVVHHLGRRAAAERAGSIRQRAMAAARVRGGALLSPGVRSAVVRRLGLDDPPPKHLARLRHHYSYWQTKWGWDPLNPDMEEIRRRWGDTEVCWSLDPERRQAGAEIVSAYHSERGGTTTQAGDLAYHRRHGFLPPPAWSSLTRYDHILDVIRTRGLCDLDADFLEIGVLLGGGVFQLAKLLERGAPGHKVIAVDIFEPGVDATTCTTGNDMASIYRSVLEDRDQYEIYTAVVGELSNVETVVGDSTQVELPTERIAFAHIDGNHDPVYVRSDFENVWRKLVPGGVVAFDDYGFDLPEVTETVDALRAEHASEIVDFWVAGLKTAFVQKAS